MHYFLFTLPLRAETNIHTSFVLVTFSGKRRTQRSYIYIFRSNALTDFGEEINCQVN